MRPSDNEAGECYPVSRGALLRNDNITPQDLPSDFSYAVVQHELYKWQLHPDGVSFVTQQFRSVGSMGKKTKRWVDIHHADDTVVKMSSHDPGKYVVEDRLYVYFEKGRKLSTIHTVSQEFYQEYYLPADNPELCATLVFSREDLKTHEPSGRVSETVFGPGIEHLKTVDKNIDAAFLDRHNVPKIVNGAGLEEYKVLCRVVIKYQGGHDMTIGWEMLIKKPRSQWVGEDKYDEVRLWEDDDTVWDAKFSQFVEQPKVEDAEDEGDDEGEEEGEEASDTQVDTPMADG